MVLATIRIQDAFAVRILGFAAECYHDHCLYTASETRQVSVWAQAGGKWQGGPSVAQL